MYNLTSSFSWATEMAIPFFHSSLVCIKAQYGSSLYGNPSESMDGFCFSFCSWLYWIQILPFQTCAAQQSKARRFQLKNVGVWQFIVILNLLLHLTSWHLCVCKLVCLMTVRLSDLFKSVLICASYVRVAACICVCTRLHDCVRGSWFDWLRTKSPAERCRQLWGRE